MASQRRPYQDSALKWAIDVHLEVNKNDVEVWSNVEEERGSLATTTPLDLGGCIRGVKIYIG